MSAFEEDLLSAALRLLRRRAGQKGPLKSAFVRRSLSTSYYAIFHFSIDEAASRLIGTGNSLRPRRRLFKRTFSHTGLTLAFGKLKGAYIEKSVEDLFRLPGMADGRLATPAFVQQFATAYLDAKAKREDADYNLNEPLSETDARQLLRRVRRAMNVWKAAKSVEDRDAKHAVALLMSLKGKLKEQ